MYTKGTNIRVIASALEGEDLFGATGTIIGPNAENPKLYDVQLDDDQGPPVQLFADEFSRMEITICVYPFERKTGEMVAVNCESGELYDANGLLAQVLAGNSIATFVSLEEYESYL